jgi:hypothetical protein
MHHVKINQKTKREYKKKNNFSQENCLPAMSLLVNLETARQERSMLLSDEPKTKGKGKEKGVCVEYQIGF